MKNVLTDKYLKDMGLVNIDNEYLPRSSDIPISLQMVNLQSSGKTLNEIGDLFGLTGCRVNQRIKNYHRDVQREIRKNNHIWWELDTNIRNILIYEARFNGIHLFGSLTDLDLNNEQIEKMNFDYEDFPTPTVIKYLIKTNILNLRKINNLGVEKTKDLLFWIINYE